MMQATMELRALLADATQCGAYFVDARDREAMTAAAASLDFALVAIELDGCRDKDDALARFASALRFPDWFGGNWDAMADCIGDLSWWPADGYVLMLDHVAGWRDAASDDFDTTVGILNQAAGMWAGRGTPFWALMPLPAEVLATIKE